MPAGPSGIGPPSLVGPLMVDPPLVGAPLAGRDEAVEYPVLRGRQDHPRPIQVAPRRQRAAVIPAGGVIESGAEAPISVRDGRRGQRPDETILHAGRRSIHSKAIPDSRTGGIDRRLA